MSLMNQITFEDNPLKRTLGLDTVKICDDKKEALEIEDDI